MKKKNIMIFLFLIIAILSIILLYKIWLNSDKEFNKEEIKLHNVCPDKRQCIFDKDIMLIGNNQKELKNLYYDIKVERLQNIIKLNINKLWKFEFDEKLYEEEYVMDLINYMQTMVKGYNQYLFSENDKNKIKECIINGYINSKEDISYEQIVKIENIALKFYSMNYELIIEVIKN